MAGIDQGLVGQGQQLVEQRVELRHRVAVLEIGATGPSDEQRIPGEHPVVHHEAVGIAGVAGGMESAQTDPLDIDRVAIANTHRDDVHRCLEAHHGDAFRSVSERSHSAHVVCVDMSIHHLGQREIELAKERHVALDLFQNRVDDEGFAADATGHQVGIAAPSQCGRAGETGIARRAPRRVSR